MARVGLGRLLAGVLCLTGLVTAHDVRAGHFDGRYSVHTGDLNGDGRTDLHVQHSPRFIPISLDDILIPIQRNRTEIDEFVLQQTASGGFDLISNLTPAQKNSVAQWPRATLERHLGDFNADGRVDMLIKGISTVVPGAQDAMVFAPLAGRGPPRAVRTVDNNYRKFVRDVAGRLSDPAYFEPGWTLVAIEYVSRVLPTYDCGGGLYWRDLSSLYSTPDSATGGGFQIPPQNPPQGCTFVGNWVWHNLAIEHWVFDPSNYSDAAITFLRAVLPNLATSNPMPASTAQSAVDQLTAALQVQYGNGPDGFNFTYDVFGAGAIGGIDGLPLPRPGSPPTALPPVFIPGTPENREWAELFHELLRRIADTLTVTPTQPQRHDCLAVTEPNVRSVLITSPMLTMQPAVSAAEIALKVEVIKYQGVGALPPIKVDGFVICDGHHRYIAARLCRTEMPQQEWTAPMSLPRYPVSSLRLDP